MVLVIVSKNFADALNELVGILLPGLPGVWPLVRFSGVVEVIKCLPKLRFSIEEADHVPFHVVYRLTAHAACLCLANTAKATASAAYFGV